MLFLFDGFELDTELPQLRRAGKVLKVDAPVLRLLCALVRSAGQLVPKEELVAEVWEGRQVTDNVITVAMARLRKVLQSGNGREEFITTSYGRGYCFVCPVMVREEPARASAPPAQAGPPFVGRARVLGRLRDAVKQGLIGRGRVCLLMGEPGIGKTRVLEMLERELAGSPVRVAWAYCQHGLTPPPLYPWEQLLREMLGANEGRDEAILSTLTPRLPAPAAPGQAQGQPPARDDAARHRVFAEILESFTRVAAKTPWLLVFDDLHSADAASLELLTHLLDRVARLPIVVAATLRATQAGLPERSDPLLLRILGHRNCERIALERLGPEEVASYVGAQLEDPHGKLGRAVYEKSEGNPFFMTELSRQLRDVADPRPEVLAVPDAALDLLRQRVAHVNDNARGLLSVCSVLGRSFELSMLAEVVRRDPDGLMTSLDQALRADVIVCAPGSRTSFAFSHELIRAVLYEGMPASERRAQHLAVADVLERRLLKGEPVHMSEVAHHAHAALPLGDLHRTVRFCRAAAQMAIGAFALRDVARYTRHALEALLLLDRPSVRLRMNLLYVTAIYSRPHDPAGYVQSVEELIRLGREHNNGEMLVRAAGLLHVHPGLKPLPHARAVLEQGLGLLPADRHGLRALALSSLAMTAPRCTTRACEALLQEAVDLARAVNSTGALSMALLRQLYLMGGPAHAELAGALAAELTGLERQYPVELAQVPVDLAFHGAAVALSQGKLGQAKLAIERAAARSRQLHHAELTWHAERALALQQIAAGEVDAGRAALRALHVRAPQLRLFGTELFCAFDRALHLGQPELEREESWLKAMLYDPEDEPAIWAMKVRALVHAGLREEARAALFRVEPEALALWPCSTDYLGALSHVVHAVVALGESRYYEPLSALLRPHSEAFAAHLLGAADGPVSYLLGLLAAESGELTSASALFAQALSRSERAGWLQNAALLRRKLARRALRSGPPARGLHATREPVE